MRHTCPTDNIYQSAFETLPIPDRNKHKLWETNDENAEDVTDQVQTTYAAKEALQEIMADVSEVGIDPTCNLLHVVATT